MPLNKNHVIDMRYILKQLLLIFRLTQPCTNMDITAYPFSYLTLDKRLIAELLKTVIVIGPKRTKLAI